MKKYLIFPTLFFLFSCASDPYTPGLRTPPQKDPRHSEGRFQGVGGLSLFRQSWEAESAQPKAAVILVHGLKDHSSRYDYLAKRLSADGYAVYSYDHRGHGDSEGQRVWVDSFDDYVSDLELYYDYVTKAEKGRPVYIFGHSMGGAIVTLFALRHPDKIKGVILSGPALKVTDDIGSFLIGTTKVIGSIFPTMAVLDLPDEKFSRDPAVVEQIKNDPLVYHGKGPAKTAKELLSAIAYIQEHMSDMNVPVLVLHGKKDLLTNPEGSRELFRRAATKDKAIKLYPNTFHDLMHEPEKEIVATDILTWLNWHTGK